jgi:Xaa-Pro aminopeptidase
MGQVKKARLEAHFMGFAEGRVSFIGHGLGLEINELPVITARPHTVLREGMVLAIEPKFVFPDEGVVGIEVDFIVRDDRLERVTGTPVDLVMI